MFRLYSVGTSSSRKVQEIETSEPTGCPVVYANPHPRTPLFV